VLRATGHGAPDGAVPGPGAGAAAALDEEARRMAESKGRKRSERRTYLVAAVMSSLGVTSMAVAAVYYRFSWQMKVDVNVLSLAF
jgi:beta-carotene 3-hydroxylase